MATVTSQRRRSEVDPLTPDERALAALSARLGHQFHSVELLRQALTHSSALGPDNERLEFLGDAVLGMIIADELCVRFPNADEGSLTRLRASLVNRTRLAEVAQQLAIGPVLRLGEGERKSGGWRRDSILANALEAIIGALYLDADLSLCRERVLAWLESSFAGLSPQAVVKDAKTTLQEWLQARGLQVPMYVTLAVEGAPHHRMFTVECRIEAHALAGRGTGSSRRRAEQAAAEAALALLTASGSDTK